MPSVLAEARQMCPELSDAVKILDHLAYTRRYDEVFEDFINWQVWQNRFPPSDENPLDKKYNEKEKGEFLKIFQTIQAEVRKRTSLWVNEGKAENERQYLWYDAVGRLYEVITSQNKSSMLGQFFTPETVVDMMVGITITDNRERMLNILDPACGSGRMGISSAIYAMKRKTGAYISMVDIDPICAKMTAVNMCFNGVVGEVSCMNGLDMVGKSFRFGYQVIPALSQFPQDMWEYYRMFILMKTRQDIKKQYLIVPIEYEQTFLKRVNDNLMEEYKQAKAINEEQERERAIEEVKTTLKGRLAGSLFEGDTALLDDIPLPTEEELKAVPSKPKKKDAPPPGHQGSLFG